MNYPQAVAWLAEHLDDEAVPLRLHDRSIGDDGAPRFSSRFLAWLASMPFDAYPVSVTRTCFHPQLARRESPYDCPTCTGSGVFDATEWHYRRPMRAALESLRLSPGDWPERQEPPAMILRALVAYALDGPAAALAQGISWDAFEALCVMATAKLRGRYAVIVPARIGYLDKSESQRAAEDLQTA